MPCSSTMLVTRRPPCQIGPPALRGKAVTTDDALQRTRGPRTPHAPAARASAPPPPAPSASRHRLTVTPVELNVIKLAKRDGARVCTIGAHPENEQGRLADLTVLVPGQIFGSSPEVLSIQPMASLLEQALFLFEDIVVMLLIEKRGVSMAEMQRRHTNLEGVMGEFA